MTYFVTGTDTGIGKTVVSAWLCRKLGYGYWKPVQSGTEEGTDAEVVASLAQETTIHPSAYRLKAPLSPHQAALREGIPIYLKEITDNRPRTGSWIIEGAGGIHVPLNDQDQMIDLMEALNVPVILVARSTLGTINHTLLSLSSLRAREIPIAGVITVGPDNAENLKSIEHFGQVKILAHLPNLDPLNAASLDQVELAQFTAHLPNFSGMGPGYQDSQRSRDAVHLGSGMRGKNEIINDDRNKIWHPFTQHQNMADPIVIARAKGATLFDMDGKAYLDMISSWWVNIHGHAHPAIAEAIAEQALTLEHVMFAGFTHRSAVTLSKSLLERAPAYDKVFFTDNGSTAVESALKMAYQYWRNLGEKRSRFLAFEGGYHGDTFGAMAVGSTSGFYDPFFDLLCDVDFVPYPHTWLGDDQVETKEQASLQQLKQILGKHSQETAAMILEPLVQGASGMRMCRPEFLEQVVRLCQEAGVLVIFDEVMTGFGRTGKLFAHQWVKAIPDIVCLSKGITGGFLPLAVTLCQRRIFDAFLDADFGRAFAHGHSYTANPLACAAAVASLNLFETENTLSHMDRIAQKHTDFIHQLQGIPTVHRIRQQGTILAFDRKEGAAYGSQSSLQMKQAFLDRGLNIRPLGDTIYFLPPYCITNDELATAYQGVEEVLG